MENGAEKAVLPASDESPSSDTHAPRFGRAELKRVVQRALNSGTAQVDDWAVCPLTYDYTSPITSPITAGIYRVTGTARDAEQRVSWSLVLKVVRSAAGVTMPNGEVVPRDLPDGPAFFGYWKREPLAYGAGLTEDLPGGMIASRCYGLSEQPDGTVWLWLEEIAAAPQARWTRERCGLAARTLGRFNGAYLLGRPVPLPAVAG